MERLQHTVLASSSEDPEFPASNLTEQGPQTRGWQSSRDTTFPQELVLSLNQYSRLQQIQLLSHEYKITSRIELSVGTLPTDASDLYSATWRRLGSVSFDSNERSNYHARELKSVHIDAEAQLLKLVLHTPHPNRYNTDNQVALVAVNVHGVASIAPGVRQQDILPPAAVKQAVRPANGGPLPRVSSQQQSAEVDRVTAEKIGELSLRKAAAVEEEDYDTAKALKQEIDRMKAIGGRILELERRKSIAIEEEDYDTAKAIKGEISKIRAGGTVPAAADEIVIRADATAQGAAALDSSPLAADAFQTGRSSRSSSDVPHNASGMTRPRGTADSEARAAQGTSSRRETAEPDAVIGDPPQGWPPGLPQPEALSPADAKEADDLDRLLGPYVAAALYSRSWQLREAALQRMEDFLRAQDTETQRLALPAATRAIQRAVKERVPNVFQAGMNVLAGVVVAASTSRDAASLTADVLPTLLDKIGDSNARIQAAASEAILKLAQVPESGLLGLATTFVKPQRQTVWRLVLARLQLLLRLVQLWGLAAAGSEGLQLEPVMKYIGPTFSNANAEVRGAATTLTVQVIETVGLTAVEKLLPRDLNPKIREQLGGTGQRPASPPLPGSARRRTSGSSNIAGPAKPAERRRSSENGMPPKPPAAERRSSGRVTQQEPVLAPPAQPATTTVQLQDLAAEAYEDDPMPYQQELIAREQLLGPDHPDVAMSLSNLAILHNQRGENELAAPLYERALDIFERHFGPSSPSVAHTLTDLAVLHLEQGDVEAGRPLLERALAIQEQALGPDHPDVVAIKDVLKDGSDDE